MDGRDSMDESGEIGRLQGLGAHDPAGATIAAFAEAHRRAGDADKALHLAEEGLAAQPDLVAARVARALALLDLGRAAEARQDLEDVLRIVADHPLARSLAQAMPSADPAEPESESFGGLDEGELDAAFVAAESETDQMVSANDFAEAAIHAIDDEPESPWEAEDEAPGAAWAAAADERSAAWDGPAEARSVAVASSEEEPELELDWDRDSDDAEIEWDQPESEAPAAAWARPEEDELVIEAEPEDPALAAAPGSPYATATMAQLLDEQGHRSEAASLRDALATKPAPAAPQARAEDAPAKTSGDSEDRRILSTLEGWLSNLRRRTE